MQHGPQPLDGPVRGAASWWRGLGAQPGPDLSAAGAPSTSAEERTSADDSRSMDVAIRWDLVERVRGEIAAGTYDTPQRWQAALDRLLDCLERQS